MSEVQPNDAVGSSDEEIALLDSIGVDRRRHGRHDRGRLQFLFNRRCVLRNLFKC